jgi:hypothetical protein
MICPTGRAKYFYQEEWTVESALIGLVKLDYWRKSLFVVLGASKAGGYA